MKAYLKELRGVLLDGPEEPVALVLVVHDGSTGHPTVAERRYRFMVASCRYRAKQINVARVARKFDKRHGSAQGCTSCRES